MAGKKKTEEKITNSETTKPETTNSEDYIKKLKEKIELLDSSLKQMQKEKKEQTVLLNKFVEEQKREKTREKIELINSDAKVKETILSLFECKCKGKGGCYSGSIYFDSSIPYYTCPKCALEELLNYEYGDLIGFNFRLELESNEVE